MLVEVEVEVLAGNGGHGGLTVLELQRLIERGRFILLGHARSVLVVVGGYETDFVRFAD